MDTRLPATPISPAPAPAAPPVPLYPLKLNVNGQQHQLHVEAWVSLLDLLRDRLALTGTKKGCDHGQCGACTVLVDGKRINSCLTLAVMQEGRSITTVEGLADGERCIRCSRPSSPTTPFNAAIAPRASCVRPWA